MKIKEKSGPKKIPSLYLAGFYFFLLLPVVAISPWFFPPDWGKALIARSIVAALSFFLVFYLLYKREEIELPEKFNKNTALWFLAALLIIFFLASVFSVDPVFSFWGSPERSGGFANIASYIIFAILSFFILKKNDWPKIWVFSICIGILVAFVAVFQFYGLFSNVLIPFSGRPPSTIGGPIFLGIYLLLLFFPTLGQGLKETKPPMKIFYGLATLLFFYVILITGSRAAYVGLAVGILYFVLFYPKKMPAVKISALILLVLGVLAVYYVNYVVISPDINFPKFLEQNKIFQAVHPRLLVKSALADPRFSAWKVAWEAIKEKPVLGWGLENFSVGFDKHYDPSLPYISKAWGGWWDRAHNIIFETGATAGIPAVVAYLALFAVLLWQLQKIKNANKNPGDESDRILNISVHAIQATFIAYLAANFFSFDTSSSYIVFFMIVGYSLYLINENILKNSGQQQESLPNNFLNKTGQKIVAFRKPVIVVLSFLLLYFLWQYNLKPYQISVQLNIVDNLTEAGQCPEAFARLEKVLPKKSFLEAYTGLEYVKTIKKCAELHPENDLEYAKKGAEVLKTSVISRPLYTRSWIYLGGFATIMASKETDQTKKENLLSEARSYMEKASALAPKHQEIIIEAAKTELVAENYKAMKEKTNECIALDPGLGECYWYLSLAELYLKDFENAKNNAKKAYENGFNISSNSSLFQLANVYVRLENYEGLALVYEQLVLQNPSVAQYHSSLAFIYREMGYYKRSRLEALKFLEMMPEAKEEVDAFLKTLPE